MTKRAVANRRIFDARAKVAEAIKSLDSANADLLVAVANVEVYDRRYVASEIAETGDMMHRARLVEARLHSFLQRLGIMRGPTR